MDDGGTLQLIGALGGVGGIIALIGMFVGYGRLQGKVSELSSTIAEMKAEDKLLHTRISEKSAEYRELHEVVIRLDEGVKHIRETLARHFPPTHE